MSGTWQLMLGDCVEALDTMADQSVHCSVSSPPYLALRDYDGVEATDWPEITYVPIVGLEAVTVPAQRVCLGHETDPLAFVAHLVHVYRKVHRVLRDDGTTWINLGDTYATSGGKDDCGFARTPAAWRQHKKLRRPGGIRRKNAMMIPERLMLALQADGWIARMPIIWRKSSAMPESVEDRPGRAHEHILLLTKTSRYHYSPDAVTKPLSPKTATTWGTTRRLSGGGNRVKAANWGRRAQERTPRLDERGEVAGARLRSVWDIAAQPRTGEGHYAAFPDELAARCILLGCPLDGIVLDPFAGRGTTGVVARRLGRSFVGIEASPTYAALARRNLRNDRPLLAPSEESPPSEIQGSLFDGGEG
ncbi:MAG: site-specific DNA-methyltransferase [Acidobacteriota bacterium]